MKLLLILVFTALLSSCKNTGEELYTSKNIFINNIQTNDSIHPGEKLLKTYCIACHSPSASHDNRLAPPMIAIKKHYTRGNISKSEFIISIQEVIKNPEEKGKMYGAINRFGPMPKASYPDGTISIIADYIYDNEIDQPKWFEGHHRKKGKHQN